MNCWLNDDVLHTVTKLLVKDQKCAILSVRASSSIYGRYDLDIAFRHLIGAAKAAGKIPGSDRDVLEYDKRQKRATLHGRALGFMLHVNTNHFVVAWYEPRGDWLSSCTSQTVSSRPKLWILDSFYSNHAETWGTAIKRFLVDVGIIAVASDVQVVTFNNIARQYMDIDSYNCGAFGVANLVALVKKECPFHGHNICSSFRLARQCREYMACVLKEQHAGWAPLFHNVIEL
jgi:hypothetical protein